MCELVLREKIFFVLHTWIHPPMYIIELLEVDKRQRRLLLLTGTPDQQYLLLSHFSFRAQRSSDTPSHVSLEDPTAENSRKFKILVDFKWMIDDRGLSILLGRFENWVVLTGSGW